MTRAVTAAVAVAALALIVPGCGGDAEHVTTREHTRRAARGITTAVRRAPLTNLPDRHGAARRRSALAVKIENTPEARPQSGLDVADVVYEEVVEGGITRFWAVFDSAAPDRVGPIRSVRRMDADIVSPLGGVVAYSGGTEPNVALIRQTPVIWVDGSNAADAFFRERSRDAPHNLYARPSRLWRRGGRPVPPASLFAFLPPRQAFAGEPVGRVTVGFRPGYEATYSYDHATETWKRSHEFVAFEADSGAQIAPVNVIVQFVRYDGAGDGQLIGTGDAWVLSGGRMVKGRWSKSTASDPTRFSDVAGAPIRLRPGRTWVELLPIGSRVTVNP